MASSDENIYESAKEKILSNDLLTKWLVELEKRTVRKFGTHATFEGIFQYLVQGGYVKKKRSETPCTICDN